MPDRKYYDNHGTSPMAVVDVELPPNLPGGAGYVTILISAAVLYDSEYNIERMPIIRQICLERRPPTRESYCAVVRSIEELEHNLVFNTAERYDSYAMHEAFMTELDVNATDYEAQREARDRRTPVFKHYFRQGPHIFRGNLSANFQSDEEVVDVLVVRAPLQPFIDHYRDAGQNINFETCCGGDYDEIATEKRFNCFVKGSDEIRHGTEWVGYLSFMMHYCCAKRVSIDTHRGVTTDLRYWGD